MDDGFKAKPPSQHIPFPQPASWLSVSPACCTCQLLLDPTSVTCCDRIPHAQGDFSGSAEEGGIKHCLQLQDAGAINPVAYLNGLAKAVTDMGGTIYESTRVRKPDRSVLQTEAGNKVR